MGKWRDRTRFLGATLLVGGVVTPFVAIAPGAGAAVGPTSTTVTVVQYSCSGVGFAAGLGTLPTQNVSVTLSAPTEVTVGQAFVVTADIPPLTLAESPIALSVQANMPLNPVGATGSAGGAGLSGVVTAAGAIYTVPQFTMTATPTVAAGGTVSFTTGNIAIVQGSTGFACSRVGAGATISTNVVGALTTSTTTSTSTTTTIFGQTTTTADPNQPTSTTSTSTTSTSTTSTTAPPTSSTTPPTIATTTAPTPTVPAAIGGQVAKIVTPSATASFQCAIYNEKGERPFETVLAPNNVTITITLPDKVGVGGVVSGLVKMVPGPKNGPVALKANTVTYAIAMSVSGATPAKVTATGGPNGAQIEAFANADSPNMPFSVTTTAAAGGQVSLGVTQVEVGVPTSKLWTRCEPVGTSVSKVASVDVVADAVVASAELTKSVVAAKSSSVKAATASASDGGYANCAAAKAAGRGTIVKTDPAYRTRLDGDGDGLACEADDPSVLGTSLARTGSNTATLLTVSALSVGLGAGLLLITRRRRAAVTVDA